MRKPVIGVMGGSKASRAVAATARRLGDLIARRDWILLTGGRNVGVMAASARGAKEAGGFVIGVLPDSSDRKACPHLDVVIRTDMGDARNVINVLSSDVVIACPGRMGTLSEVALALNAGKRVILAGFELCDPPFRKYIKSGQLTTAATPEDAINQTANALSNRSR
ncbi:MAG: TIGR00725 family protein [Phycisphaerales bacterium]|nr:TIGR00725 family protein [Phycisphaerales bacterium]